MRRSDSLPPFPPRFGSPRKGGTALRSLSRSRDCRALLATGQGFGGPVSPRPVFPAGTTEPPRFLGNPLCPCPALRPRWDLHARPFTAFRCGLPCFRRRRLPPQTPFGAPSHGLVTRCLRFASGLPRPAQDSLPAAGQALPGGIQHPPGSTTRFPRYLHLFPLIQAYPGAPESSLDAFRTSRKSPNRRQRKSPRRQGCGASPPSIPSTRSASRTGSSQ
jgi:hypothetical protein